MKIFKTESAGGVVINSKGQVLVVNQRGRSWSLPKGHVEAGESLEVAALREIEEESGLKNLTIIKKLGDYERTKIPRAGDENPKELKHIHLFLCITNETHLEPTDPDNPEARWVEWNKVVDLLTHEKDKEFYLSILKDLPISSASFSSEVRLENGN